MRNKYRGVCQTCSSAVAAGEGFYADGQVFCSEPIWYLAAQTQTVGCLIQFNQQHGTACASADEAAQVVAKDRQIKLDEGRERVRVALVNGGLIEAAADARVRSLDAVIEKVLGSVVAINEMSWDQITEVRNELQRRSRARERRGVLKTHELEDKCPRCGGAGGADKWKLTGWTCHRCLGSGKF